jgi:hypothetical protein
VLEYTVQRSSYGFASGVTHSEGKASGCGCDMTLSGGGIGWGGAPSMGDGKGFGGRPGHELGECYGMATGGSQGIWIGDYGSKKSGTPGDE